MISIKSIANKACQYAREHIQAGASQLENQLYAPEIRNVLYKHINLIRDVALQNTNSYLYFEEQIALCKKFAFGNCGELSMMALDYMVREHPEINAEQCIISYGEQNHAFLVIGRLAGSDACNPDTWGDDAYICDPWQNEVYPASEYLNKMKIYYLDIKLEDYPNEEDALAAALETKYTEANFDKNVHKIKISTTINNLYILKQSDQKNFALFNAFNRLNEAYLSIFDELATKLKESIHRLEQANTKNDKIIKILQKKVTAIEERTSTLRKNIAQCIADNKSTKYQPYTEFKTNLKQRIKQEIQSLREARTLSDNKLNQLVQNKSPFNALVRYFFDIPQTLDRTIQTEYIEAVNEAEEKLSRLKYP